MTDTTTQPTFWRRLATTPWVDLLRGRITGRGDLALLIDRADLPDEARTIIRDVVRRTRLLTPEKIDVATELIAHFTDGLKAGHSIEELSASFGDARSVARLIRRAKMRNRSIARKLARLYAQLCGAALAIYVLAGLLLYIDRPSPGVDYLAMLNAPALAVPESERAWPIYRQAMIDVNFYDGFKADDPFRVPADPAEPDGPSRDVLPADAQWPQAAAFLEEHADFLAALRAGAARPTLGFVLGHDLTHLKTDDRLALGGTQWQAAAPFAAEDRVDELVHDSLIHVTLPYLGSMRELARLLAYDIVFAAQRGDAQRVVDNVVAMLGMSGQAREQRFLVCELVGLAIAGMAVNRVGEVLHDKPDLLTDDQLRQLAHLLAVLNDWRTPDFTGETWAFQDIIQRIYGRSGRVTMQGLFVWNGLIQTMEARHGGETYPAQYIVAATPLAGLFVASRDEIVVQHRRLMEQLEEEARQPFRKMARYSSMTDWQLAKWASWGLMYFRYGPLTNFTPALGRAAIIVRSGHCARVAMQVAIAAELYKRRHGSYPDTVEQLVPQYLPEAPLDESATAGNILIAVRDGGLVVYGRGFDDDDDGGVPYRRYNWPTLDYMHDLDQPEQPASGDWLLYPAP